MSRRVTPIEDRFWQKVHEDHFTDCWIWRGAMTNGYGKIGIGRRGQNVEVLAHRWAYEHVVGKIPGDMVIDHLCRNPICVNPAHLEPVTMRENNLRGQGWSGRHARKTHCPKGHLLAGDNLSRYHLSQRQRKCLKCHADRQRRYKAKLRAVKSRPHGVASRA